MDAFVSGSRGLLIERILGEERVAQDHGIFYLDTPTDRLPDAVFRYGRALTRSYDLTLHSRPRSVSTFYDDLANLIIQTADEEQVQRELDFDSILAFSDQTEIPRLDLARLSDVGGDMVSSLESSADLRRKLERRMA